ncbi:acyltransferase [Bordetella avium]|uniref:acyltransferase family protein n=1 Tax=Bordetella avium TaxID=521 RepID=UPI000E0A4063|nr:acyltransferase [Bordetella avium]RIQ13057.1 acyltransferase [Bordetella avium]RIQ54084.1 acyltransferase [Bordetella avium]RIQ62487.1 acyltransferase [Bordetella avium]RIQ63607.1 acyltransferase [Bordetella avium]RIQ78852.1 acyltransferase [Bordetella avium]
MDILSIQYLRGVAAMMVVAVHLYPQLERMGYQGYWPHWLAAGVDIFFVLSGFLMWITTRGKKVGVWQFYGRRAARIVPLYWLLTSVAVAVMLIAPQLLQTARFGLSHVVASYFFIMTPNPAGLIEPVLTVGWTLNYEMLFYVIFGLALLLPASWRFSAVTLVLLGLSMVGWFVADASTPILQVYTSDIVLEFLLGMGVGVWFSHPHRGGSALLGAAMVVGGFVVIALLSVLAPEVSRPLVRGVPAAVIVAGAILLERFQALPRMAWLHKLGDASYSLYLSHAFVLSALSQAWRKLHLDTLPGGWVGFGLAGLLACTVAGMLVYAWLERPLISLFKRPSEQAASKAATRRSVAGL